jgi:hypothetical protein
MRLRMPAVYLPLFALILVFLCATARPTARQNVPATLSVVLAGDDGKAVDEVNAAELAVEVDGRRVAITAVERRIGPYEVVVLYADSLMGRSSTSRANDIVNALLREAPQEHEIGFLNTSGEPPRHVPPTLDRDLVRRSLRGLLGQASVAGPMMWSDEPTFETMSRLELLARDVRREPDATPRVILLIADTIQMAMEPSMQAEGPQAILQWWRARLEFRAADVPLYTVSTHLGRQSPNYRLNPHQRLADETGGLHLPLTPDRGRQARTLLDDLDVRHRLTLDLPASALTEDTTLTITTTRPGATVRYARWEKPS